ncbi:MAG: multidrug transporter [Bacillus sp. (in: firmicutes)]
MDIEKKKPSVPRLDKKLKNNHETNGKEMNRTIKETIAKNKKIIEKNCEILRKK